MKGIVIPDADISIYDAKVTAYFTGVERYEQKLKQDGIIPAQNGGTDFPVELFRETCKLAYEKCFKKPRVGLFNLMAWYTCGRSTNVANMHIEHFVLDGDCMGIQFPLPAAPPKAGGRERQVIPSKNSVGTVRKNMSLLSLCAAE